MTLKGRRIVVTGAGQGLGRAIAERCLREGARVYVCARGKESAERAVAALGAVAPAAVAGCAADVGDPASAAAFFKEAVAFLGGLDGLVNNAGVYGPIAPLEDAAWDEWADAVRVNLLGTALCCRHAVPLLRAQGRGRIVNLSGGGATAPQPRFSAYAASKAAVVRLTETLAVELAGTGVTVNAVAPGPLNTRLLDQVLAAGPERAGKDAYEKSLKQAKDGGAPLEKGADLVAFLLGDASGGVTGRLLSALWDPWAELPARAEAVAKTDVYTLRRIVPKDRGLDWG